MKESSTPAPSDGGEAGYASEVTERLPWRAALRAGLLAQLAASLVLTLVLLTAWAGQSEFPGHQHPWGGEEHVHGLSQVIGAWAAPQAPLALPRPQMPAAWVRVLILQVLAVLVLGAHRSRAPPAAARLRAAARSHTLPAIA